MKQLSPQRRKVVVLAAAVACMSGIGPLLIRGHHTAGLIWIGFMAVMLVFVIIQFARLMKAEQ